MIHKTHHQINKIQVKVILQHSYYYGGYTAPQGGGSGSGSGSGASTPTDSNPAPSDDGDANNDSGNSGNAGDNVPEQPTTAAEE